MMNPTQVNNLHAIEQSYFYDKNDGDLSTIRCGIMTSGPDTEFTDRSVLVTGNGNRTLAENIALLLKVELHPVDVGIRSGNGEVTVDVRNSVLGKDVFVIQSTAGNHVIDTNTALMELFLLVRKVKLCYAKKITVIIPYLAYSCQGFVDDDSEVLTTDAVARIITKMGADHVVTLDMHSGQTAGFFDNIPVDNLYFHHEFATYLSHQLDFDLKRTVVIAPSTSTVPLAKKLADVLRVPQLATIICRRLENGTTTNQIVGNVEGMHCVIVTDILDTGFLVVDASNLLIDFGAINVVACCTHAIMAGNCCELINNCLTLKQVIVSDSIPQEEHQKLVPKLKTLSVAPLLALAISKYAKNEDIQNIFMV